MRITSADTRSISQNRSKLNYLKGGECMDKYLTPQEVADRYGVKVITVWSWIREKKLKAIKTGKMYHIRPQDLAEFEESRQTK